MGRLWFALAVTVATWVVVVAAMLWLLWTLVGAFR